MHWAHASWPLKGGEWKGPKIVVCLSEAGRIAWRNPFCNMLMTMRTSLGRGNEKVLNPWTKSEEISLLRFCYKDWTDFAYKCGHFDEKKRFHIWNPLIFQPPYVILNVRYFENTCRINIKNPFTKVSIPSLVKSSTFPHSHIPTLLDSSLCRTNWKSAVSQQRLRRIFPLDERKAMWRIHSVEQRER